MTELDHASLVVSDVERSLAWWKHVLRAETGECVVRLGTSSVHLVQAATESEGAFALRNDAVGALHVCLRVPDIADAHSRLLANGVVPSTPPRELIPGVHSLYFRDPDGIQLQLIEGAGDLSLHHVAHSVSDLGATLSWYHATFDLAPTYRSTAAGPQIREMLETACASYSVALLPVGDAHLELMQWDDPTASPARRTLSEPGAWHIGVTVEGFVGAGAPDELAGLGCLGRGDVACHDPDGFLVHVLEAPPQA